MPKINFHPNAYIPHLRNKKKGLKARTKILNEISDIAISLKELKEKTNLTNSSLTYHLKLLEKNKFIQKKKTSKNMINIKITGLGQKNIKNYIKN